MELHEGTRKPPCEAVSCDMISQVAGEPIELVDEHDPDFGLLFIPTALKKLT
jgi:hypothetical protein